MPLSATALLLADIVYEVEPTSIDTAVVQEPLVADPGGVITMGTLDTDSPMVCQPVTAAELTSIPAQADESIDIVAIEAVMEMGPEAWIAEDGSGDESEQFSDLTLMGGPAPPPGWSFATHPIVVAAPEIVSFQISCQISGIWHFEGEVIYRFPAELDIVFGGAIEHTIKADSSGAFLLSLELPPDASGMVTVRAFTPEGVASNLVYDWII